MGAHFPRIAAAFGRDLSKNFCQVALLCLESTAIRSISVMKVRQAMSQSAETDEVQVEQPTKLKPKRQTRRKTDSRTKRQPPYAVILHNDDHNGMDFVVGVLKKVFGYGTSKAVWLMLKAHTTGQAQVWSGVLEVAELKADQLRCCGADPDMVAYGAARLRVSLEPLE